MHTKMVFRIELFRFRIHFYSKLAFKPFGLEFENSRCLFTEFANLIHFGRKIIFLQKDRQTETRTDIAAKIVVQMNKLSFFQMATFQRPGQKIGRCFCGFFGVIEDKKKLFNDLLTFSQIFLVNHKFIRSPENK